MQSPVTWTILGGLILAVVQGLAQVIAAKLNASRDPEERTADAVDTAIKLSQALTAEVERVTEGRDRERADFDTERQILAGRVAEVERKHAETIADARATAAEAERLTHQLQATIERLDRAMERIATLTDTLTAHGIEAPA